MYLQPSPHYCLSIVPFVLLNFLKTINEVTLLSFRWFSFEYSATTNVNKGKKGKAIPVTVPGGP
jgi:hypothetical protein